MRTEREILKNIAISTIKEVLNGETPTRKELSEYSKIQASKYGFDEVDFVKSVECEIPFILEVGYKV